MPRALSHILSAAFAVTLAGCASILVPDSTPIPAEKLAAPGAPTVSLGGYRYDTFKADDPEDEWVVVAAMSGGGKRSAAFSYGVLRGMRDTHVNTPAGKANLLKQLDIITGISGGSFTAAYYGLHRDAMFENYTRDFLYQDTNSKIAGIYLLPWNWTWLTDPEVGTNDFMARVYDETMFQGRTYADLLKLGKPLIALGATDISYGRPFAFTQEYFDLICADLVTLPISRGVAASNGFPGLFSPVTLTSYRAQCGDRQPGWLRAIPAADRNNPLSRIGEQARSLGPYLDPEQTKFVHLADGGITDNLGLRIVGNLMQAITRAHQGVERLDVSRLRRILVISIDGQGTQDSSIARTKLVGGIFSLLGLVSGAQIDRYNFETLSAVDDQLREAEENLKRARCAQARVLHGAACDDVRAMLVHVSLAGMPEGPDKDRLLAIPTGLTIGKTDVDALVAAGEKATRDSPALNNALRIMETREAPRRR